MVATTDKPRRHRPSKPPAEPGSYWLRAWDVAALLGVSEREVWRREGTGEGGFPRAVRQGTRTVLFLRAEAEGYRDRLLRGRAEARR